MTEGVDVEGLSRVLWRERELLDALLYRVELEQLVLMSGSARWLARVSQDVEAVLTTLGETELLRAVVADEIGTAVGLAASPTLRALAERSDEPWATILAEHRDALLALTRTIAERADANRALIAAGHRATRATLLAATTGAAALADLQVQEAAYGSALGTSARVVRTSLGDFLR
ncbi:flagellar protein FlgN [Nocardioides zeae]|uniref:flagellar protein FlgN n=1 Tax=Nocardioides zeae TaxID=1457234 RepID=UPI0027D8ACB7|nr:flagellar protein FlgN [Nocardioides zeae]